MIQEYGPRIGMFVSSVELVGLRKEDKGKAMMAALIPRHTAVSTEWMANRLHMGHHGSVSRQVGIVKRNKKLLL